MSVRLDGKRIIEIKRTHQKLVTYHI